MSAKISRAMICVFYILLACGCRTHVALTKEVKSSVRLAEVAREVKIPDNIEVDRNYYAMGLAGFLISLTDRPDQEKAKELANMLHREIPRTLYEQFVKTLKESKLFPRIKDAAAEDENPDALFILNIERFGFGPMNNKPTICVTGRLIRNPSLKKDSSVVVIENAPPLWQKHACEFGQFVELPNESLKFYVSYPEKTLVIFAIASQSVVDQFINDMRENYE